MKYVRYCLITYQILVDGEWGEWGPWSPPEPCEGQQSRVRHCDDPQPRNGGQYCPGVNYEVQPCESDLA